ncbi:hypothetical protein AMJ85_01315 [candidate division BRC1 bacterium SM23_51]|nr:MAG: hypothetical protein AMJ85_01315 [candidate division BRC1 bacterium SM23_51]
MKRPRPTKCVDCGVETRWGRIEASFEYHGIRLSITGIDGMVCPRCGRQYAPGPEAEALSRAAEEIFRAQEAVLVSALDK